MSAQKGDVWEHYPARTHDERGGNIGTFEVDSRGILGVLSVKAPTPHSGLWLLACNSDFGPVNVCVCVCCGYIVLSACLFFLLVGGLRASCVLVCVVVLCCYRFVVDFFLEFSRPARCFCLFFRSSLISRMRCCGPLLFAVSCCCRAFVSPCLGRDLPCFLLSSFLSYRHSLPLPLRLCSGQSCHWSPLRLLECFLSILRSEFITQILRMLLW